MEKVLTQKQARGRSTTKKTQKRKCGSDKSAENEETK